MKHNAAFLLLRRAVRMPPRLLLTKVAALVKRRYRALVTSFIDGVRPSYSKDVGDLRSFSISLRPALVNSNDRTALRRATDLVLAHTFDLLGSGPTDLSYGAEVRGLEGICYPRSKTAMAIAVSNDAALDVPLVARRYSRSVRDRLMNTSYTPIDWQIDFRSGYRWSAKTSWRKLSIGHLPGVDIKMPWELSRMQHLPRLAIAAVLSASGDNTFRNADVYVAEIENQLLDFISANPPRFGACWGCPMDVAIRAANWVVTLGLLEGGGQALSEKTQTIVAASLYDHARHIAENLEWSETGRSNHYFSDIVGLAFVALVLPRSAEIDTWLNFACREILAETRNQFHADGGNYEGSTSYHRLSAELAVYGLAVVARTAAECPEVFSAADETALARLRPPLDSTTSIDHNDLRALSDLLASIGCFSRSVRMPTGDMIQIGDTDSGRLFRFLPLHTSSTKIVSEGDAVAESMLNTDELVDALETLTARAEVSPANVVGEIVGALMRRGRGLFDAAVPQGNAPVLRPAVLDDLEAELMKLPQESCRILKFALHPNSDAERQFDAFPDFGLYVLHGAGVHISFRCAKHLRADAPSGHTHDDNLSVSFFDGEDHLIADPGTYVYTSLPEERNRYRLDAAHFLPRPQGRSAVETTDYLFHLDHVVVASLIYAGIEGFAGTMVWPDGCRVTRLVKVDASSVTIIDGVSGGRLASYPDGQIVRCDGYGQKTTRPVFAV